MRRHSFFTKLLLGNLLVIGVIAALGGWVSYRRLNADYLAESQADQERLAGVFQRHFEQVWRTGFAPAAVDRQCKELVAGTTMRLTVVADDGRVLGDSQAEPAVMANHKTPDRPEILAALEGHDGHQVRSSETLGVEFRYVARPIRHGDGVVAAVRLAMPVRTIIQHQDLIRGSLLWAGAGAAAAAVALALLLSWIWYAPLREISRTARALAAGDLSRRADFSGSDEIAHLGTALNEMAEDLAARIRQVAAQRENLTAVVESLREGVIETDAGGRIVLMNQAARTLLAAEPGGPSGAQFAAVVRLAEVVDVFNAVAAGRTVCDRQVEVEVNRRRCTLDVHASRLAAGPPSEGGPGRSVPAPGRPTGGILVVIRDITDLVRTATVKAEFVANASHELRTPLATIRAAVDSLAAIGPEDRQEFARLTDILHRHTARLEDMTHDLLNLHMVESGRRRCRAEAVRLGDLAAWVRESFGQRADQARIDLTADCDDPAAGFLSDMTLLELILQNLVDNAVKFTPAGGRVQCRFQAGPEQVVLRVADTGCGIAPDLRDRIFERFFQADQARSGDAAVRGTGLGLAIVKHACERLGGKVELQSDLGRGTTVTVTLPRRAAEPVTSEQ